VTAPAHRPDVQTAARKTITDWPGFEKFGALMHTHAFRFARTMPKNPHWYTLRKTWDEPGGDDDFQWAVRFLRANGYTAYYQRKPYVQLDVNEHFYWTMGAPINLPDGTPHTILINRKVLTRPAPYDDIAGRYSEMFHDPASLAENKRLFDFIGPLEGADVLDIGCGDGLALDEGYRTNLDPARYTGIDPASSMLAQFMMRHTAFRCRIGTEPMPPHADGPRLICSTLAAFMPPVERDGDGALHVKRYDRVLALFGVGSYLDDGELAKIPHLLRPGGRAHVMFYATDYKPVTHAQAGVHLPYRPFSADRFKGNRPVQSLGGHVIVTYEKPLAVGVQFRE
jgi:SAM-dependent methyltransferase